MSQRLPGSLLGAFLTLAGWATLGTTSFLAKLAVALVAFTIAHGVVRLLRRRLSTEPGSSEVNESLVIGAIGYLIPTLVWVLIVWVIWSAFQERQAADRVRTESIFTDGASAARTASTTRLFSRGD